MPAYRTGLGRFTARPHPNAIAGIVEAAQNRCAQIAGEIVKEIRRQPETPVLTRALVEGYAVLRDPQGNALIINPMPYWRFQEFGTERMAANPHVRPAIEKVRARKVP